MFSALPLSETWSLEKSTLKNRLMKKLVYFTLIFAGIVAMGSCSVDDSNDIEIIKPGDTTIFGKVSTKKPS